MSADLPDGLHEAYVRHYEQEASRVVSRLQHLAERVERAAKPYDDISVDGTGRHTYAASNVMHEIATELANVKVDALVRAAARLDVHEALIEERNKP